MKNPHVADSQSRAELNRRLSTYSFPRGEPIKFIHCSDARRNMCLFRRVEASSERWPWPWCRPSRTRHGTPGSWGRRRRESGRPTSSPPRTVAVSRERATILARRYLSNAFSRSRLAFVWCCASVRSRLRVYSLTFLPVRSTVVQAGQSFFIALLALFFCKRLHGNIPLSEGAPSLRSSFFDILCVSFQYLRHF